MTYDVSFFRRLCKVTEHGSVFYTRHTSNLVLQTLCVAPFSSLPYSVDFGLTPHAFCNNSPDPPRNPIAPRKRRQRRPARCCLPPVPPW